MTDRAFTDGVTRRVDAFEERLKVVVAEAINIERRRAAVLGVVIAVLSFALGFLYGIRC